MRKALPQSMGVMNSNLVILPKPSQLARWILAIEADSHRAGLLREVLRHYSDMNLEIVANADEAIRAMSVRLPDLVLTSTFMSPSDEATLTAHIRRIPEAADLQIVNVPYFIDTEAPQESASRGVRRFFQRRSASIRPRCDISALREYVEHYLEQARSARPALVDRYEARLVPVSSPFLLPAWSPSFALDAGAGDRGSSILGQRDDRRRARRLRREDVPHIWSVKLPFASDTNIIDISSSGVLLESTTKIVPGTTLMLQLFGEELIMDMPARMVRTDVAGVDGFGVKYHVAGAFARELDVRGLQAPVAAMLDPKALGEVLSRSLDTNRASGSPRSHFESELRRLLPLRDIQIRETPLLVQDDSESIYFTVATEGDCPQILQAIFEPGYEPTAAELRFLKAAANMAAVVVEYESATSPRSSELLTA
jgi:CheY-like chemotaxis protein